MDSDNYEAYVTFRDLKGIGIDMHDEDKVRFIRGHIEDVILVSKAEEEARSENAKLGWFGRLLKKFNVVATVIGVITGIGGAITLVHAAYNFLTGQHP